MDIKKVRAMMAESKPLGGKVSKREAKRNLMKKLVKKHASKAC